MNSKLNSLETSLSHDSAHEITMSKIAGRLHEIHTNMQLKKLSLPIIEETSDTLIQERLDEISHALLTNFSDRRKQENFILENLMSMMERFNNIEKTLEESAEKLAPLQPSMQENIVFEKFASMLERLGNVEKAIEASAIKAASIQPAMITGFCNQLGEQFFNKQEHALLQISARLDQLLSNLNEVTATKQRSPKLKEIEQHLNDVRLDLKNNVNDRPKDWQEALEKLLKNIPANLTEPQKAPVPFDANASARLIDTARKSRPFS